MAFPPTRINSTKVTKVSKEVFILSVLVLLVHGEKNYNKMESNEPCL